MKARIRFYAMGQSMAARAVPRVSALLAAGMKTAPRWACNAFLDGFEDQRFAKSDSPFKLLPHQRHTMRRLMPAFERGGLPEVSLVPHPPVRPLRTSTLDPEGAEHQWLESQGRFYVPGRKIGKTTSVVHITTPLGTESVAMHLARKDELHAALAYSFTDGINPVNITQTLHRDPDGSA